MFKETALNAEKFILYPESNGKQNEADDLGKLIWQENKGEIEEGGN